MWSIRQSFKLRQEYPFRCFLFVYFAAHISQQIASADPRTVLFGIILFLFRSVSSEEVFHSKYCLLHSYGFSAMNCSLGHCFWDLLGINNKKTRSVSRQWLLVFRADFGVVSFKSLLGNFTEMKIQWQCDVMASWEEGWLFALEN